MVSGAKLPIVILPGTKFTCHACGACCRGMAVKVTEEERARIVAAAPVLAAHVATPVEKWFEERAEKTMLGHTAERACVFLGADNLCLIHQHVGAEVKPLICQAFPLFVARRPDAIVVSIRDECETLARSRKDGEPLERQVDWIRRVACGIDAVEIEESVPFHEGVALPFEVARALDERALAFVRGAEAPLAGLLAARDVVVAVARALDGAGNEAGAARVVALLSAPLADVRAARGPAVPEKALQNLAALIMVLLAVLYADSEPPEGRGAWSFLGEVLRGLFGGLALRFGWRLAPGLREADAAEGGRALRVDSGLDDADVQDFVRDAMVQAIGGSRIAAGPEPLFLSYATHALSIVLGRFGARLLALRRGAARATAADWGLALARLGRSLTTVGFGDATPHLLGAYENLFFAKDLPS